MRNESHVFIVPTPIGNISDITLRALDVLKSVDIIYAEDTRRTRKLLNYYKIKKLVKSYNKNNEKSATAHILSIVNEDHTVALTSDAGMPCISDPGNILVKELIQNNILFEALPGPTAFIPALVESGFSTSTFFFKGFLNTKSKSRAKELSELKKIDSTILLYEAPHRIKKTLTEILDVFNPPFFVGRELSKLYAEHIYIHQKEDIEKITEKGEFVIVIDNNVRKNKTDIKTSNNESINLLISKLFDNNFSKKDIIKILNLMGTRRNIAYRKVEEVLNSS